MENENFINWFKEEIKTKSISYSEFSRRAGLSKSYVSAVMSGQRRVTSDFCIATAKAFRMNPVIVLSISGHIQSTQVYDGDNASFYEIFSIYESLTDEKKGAALSMLYGLSTDISNMIYMLEQSRKEQQKSLKSILVKIRRAEFNSKRAQLALALIERDGEKCTLCENNQLLQVDHIIPLSKGGDDEIDNLQLLCRSCNLKKRDKLGSDDETILET